MKIFKWNGKFDELSNFTGLTIDELEYYENHGNLTEILKTYDCILDKEEFGAFFNLNLTDNRMPIVSVMGHVDHGKTSLIDKLLNIKIADKETGGITQEVYVRKMDNFILIDTPGHSVFNYTRQNMMRITDVLILVIAIEDGVSEQTKEIIKHIKKQQVIICISKVDKILPTKRKKHIDKIMVLLAQEGLDLDNSTVCEVSSKTGEGIDQLLEQIQFQTEMLQIKCDRTRPGIGYIIDSQIKQGIGYVCVILLLHGQIKVGDIIVNGDNIFKIKTILINGKVVKNGSVDQIIELTGFTSDLLVGEKFYVANEDKIVNGLVTNYTNYYKVQDQIETTGFNLIVKCEKNGQIPIIKNMLLKKNYKIISISVGGITPSDLQLQKITNSMIVVWGYIPNLKNFSHIPLISDDVIYKLEEKIDLHFTKPKEIEYVDAGVANIVKIFEFGKLRIAGCKVIDKIIKKGAICLIKRKGEVILKGKISSIKREKDSITEARKGTECGLVMNFQTPSDEMFQVGDEIITQEIKED